MNPFHHPTFQRALRIGLLAAMTLALTGCGIRKRMYDQEKFEPLEATDFFGDRRSSRPLVEGTIARGNLKTDEHMFKGYTVNGAGQAEHFDAPPQAVFNGEFTTEDIVRGKERYEIYCTACHGKTGAGNGMVVRRGFTAPPTYHGKEYKLGQIYQVITEGQNLMMNYAAQVPVEDRWRIAGYIQILQQSQNRKVEELPPELKKFFDAKKETAAVETKTEDEAEEAAQ